MKSKITVIVMTYNQANYIDQTMQSILAQKINIGFDILIHDDCSDDGTYEKLLDYQKEHPNMIQIIRQESRKFLKDGFNMMIFNYVVPQVNSEFVAYCDGDDYWCDELKLQKQYDFMTNHPEYSMCFHSAYQLRPNNDMSSKWFIADEGDIDISDLINDKPGVCVATSSIFLKTNVFKDFSDWRKAYPVEDVPMYITAAIHGKIHRLKDVMCVYRQFAVGSWSAQNQNDTNKLLKHLEETKKATQYFDKETNYYFHDLVLRQIEGCNFIAAYVKKDLKTIFKKENKRFVKRLKVKERLSLKLQYRAPSLYNLLKKKKS